MARRKRKRPHGTGSYQYRDGRHVVQWTERGSRRTRTLATFEQVAPFLARASAGLEAAVAPVPAGNLADHAETWLRSRAGMASNYDDRNRWRNHLLPLLGRLQPDQVDVPVLKRTIQELRAKGLGKATTGLCMALVSSLYGDLVEDGSARLNPVRMLSRKTRANELKSDWDWRKTPFVRSTEDVHRIYLWLTQVDRSVGLGYVIGALAGLRTSEVRALRYGHVDLERRLIHVRDQVARRGGGTSAPKDDDSRFVPISDAFFEYLRGHLCPACPAEQLVCTSISGGFMDPHKMGRLLSYAFAAMQAPAMTWYQATRHTFASQWVLHGGSLETLRDMMGHSSVTVTERYAHLVPGLYSAADRARVAVERPAEPAANPQNFSN